MYALLLITVEPLFYGHSVSQNSSDNSSDLSRLPSQPSSQANTVTLHPIFGTKLFSFPQKVRIIRISLYYFPSVSLTCFTFWSLHMSLVFSFFPMKSWSFFPRWSSFPAHHSWVEFSSNTWREAWKTPQWLKLLYPFSFKSDQNPFSLFTSNT